MGFLPHNLDACKIVQKTKNIMQAPLNAAHVPHNFGGNVNGVYEEGPADGQLLACCYRSFTVSNYEQFTDIGE